MPDNLENLEPEPSIDDIEVIEIGDPAVEPEGNKPEPEPEPEPEAKKVPDSIPYSRFQEVNLEKKQAEQELAQLRAQAAQMYAYIQQQQAAQKPADRKPIDPEAAEFIRLIQPALDEYLAPVYAKLAQAENMTASMQSQTISEKAWQYVQNSVPDLKELAPEIMEYIEKRHDKDAILADPDRVVDIAEIVRYRRADKGKKVSDEVRQVARSQAKAEVPNVQPRSKTRDWGSVPDDEFNKILRDAGF